MRILVIIVSYNFERWMDRCLGSLRRSLLPAEVLVVDNASQDRTVELVERQYPEVRLIKSPENLGFGRANNLGMSIALKEGHDAVFLLNQDAWVDERTLGTLATVMNQHPQMGILSPVHLNGAGDGLDQGFAGYTQLKKLTDLEHDDLIAVPFVNAAFWMIPTGVLRSVGGFCPLFYHYGEDVDYVNRLRRHGYGVGYCPKVFGCHDREFRPVSHEQWMRAESIFHLTEYANVNHSPLHAFAYSVLAAVKKAAKSLTSGKPKVAGEYMAIALQLLRRTGEVHRYRKQNQVINAHYLH